MIEATEQQAQQAGQLVTQAEYARRIGVNRSTVTRQVQSGLIPTHNGLIDPGEADSVRRANLDVAKRRILPVPAPTSQPAVETAPPIEDLLAGIAPTAEQTSPDSTFPAEGTLKAAQVQERRAKAGLAEIELAKARGELVPTKEVEAAWSSMVLTARNRLFLLVEEIEDPTIRAKVMRKLEGILADLSRQPLAEQAA